MATILDRGKIDDGGVVACQERMGRSVNQHIASKPLSKRPNVSIQRMRKPRPHGVVRQALGFVKCETRTAPAQCRNRWYVGVNSDRAGFRDEVAWCPRSCVEASRAWRRR